MVDYDEVADRAPEWYGAINAALGLDKVDEAIRLALESLKTVRAAGDSKGEIAALRASAKANLAKGDVWNAKRNIEDNIKLARQDKDKKAEAAAQHILAKVHLTERKPEKALSVAQEALDGFKEEKLGSAAVKNTMAKVRLAQNELDMAVDLVTESINGFKDVGQSSGGADGQAYATQTLVQIRLAQKKFQDALLTAEDLNEMYINLESPNGQGLAHLAYAEVSLAMDDLQSALDEATTASEYFQQGGNKKKKATALYIMASAFASTEQWQEAGKLAESAYRVFHQAHDKRGKADSLNILVAGMIIGKLYSPASAVLTEMAFLYRQIKDKQMEAIALQKLSRNQIQMIDTPGQMPKDGWTQDDIEAPVRNAKRAVALYGEMGAMQSTAHAEALITLSHALEFTGLFTEALGRAEQAKKVYSSIGVCEVDAIIQIAQVHNAQGSKDMAQKHIEEAIDLATESGTTSQVDAARKLLDTITKKKAKEGSRQGGVGRTTFAVLFGDMVKAQFNFFESRAITIPQGRASSSAGPPKGRMPEFKPPERHAVVYETRKQLVQTDPSTGLPKPA